MKLLVLVDLAAIKGACNLREAMQIAAEETAADPREMDDLRKEVRSQNFRDADSIMDIKTKLLRSKERITSVHW